jgi:hypothetical protein
MSKRALEACNEALESAVEAATANYTVTIDRLERCLKKQKMLTAAQNSAHVAAMIGLEDHTAAEVKRYKKEARSFRVRALAAEALVAAKDTAITALEKKNAALEKEIKSAHEKRVNRAVAILLNPEC